MTLDQFVQRYIGKTVDFDGAYPGQCMDLYRLYVKDVLRLPQTPTVPSAHMVWDKASSHFDKVKNTLFAIPKKGDIIIFRPFNGNPHGHICICLDGNWWNLTSFDSNWSKPRVATIEMHKYKHIIGWLRPKQAPSSDTLDDVRRSINRVFREVFGKNPTAEENSYYLKRVKQSDINSIAVLHNKMLYWKSRGKTMGK